MPESILEESLRRVVGRPPATAARIPVSPAIKLAQKLKDLERQRQAGGVPQIPQYGGPMPTLYNVNTGEWEESSPMQAELLGVPIGAPMDPAILSRMWRGGHSNIEYMSPLYGGPDRRV